MCVRAAKRLVDDEAVIRPGGAATDERVAGRQSGPSREHRRRQERRAQQPRMEPANPKRK
jgi:hypothetical protein